MNMQFLKTWALIFVLWMVGSFVVHGTLLQADYLKLGNMMRSEADSQNYIGFMILAHVIMAGAFVWIYARGAENKPWLNQGLRFGLAAALLAIVPTYMIYYCVQPMPGSLVVKQCVFDTLLLLILGAATAWMYRAKTT